MEGWELNEQSIGRTHPGSRRSLLPSGDRAAVTPETVPLHSTPLMLPEGIRWPQLGLRVPLAPSQINQILDVGEHSAAWYKQGDSQ